VQHCASIGINDDGGMTIIGLRWISQKDRQPYRKNKKSFFFARFKAVIFPNNSIIKIKLNFLEYYYL
jgi:hypothetical protein